MMLHEPTEAIVPLGAPVFRQPERGNGIGVLLIHGFSGSPYQMRNLGELLVAHGYAISIPRLPGHASQLQYFAKVRSEDWQRSVEESFQDLQGRGLRVVILGRSFGGVLALDYACAHPKSVLGCICIGTPAPLSTQVWLRRFLPVVRLVRKSVRKPWAKPEERETRIAQGRYVELPLSAVQQFLNIMATMTPKRLQELRIPTLFIQGSTDTAVAPASLAYYERYVTRGSNTVLPLDAVGHDAEQLHSNPQVRETILQFLEKCRQSEEIGD